MKKIKFIVLIVITGITLTVLTACSSLPPVRPQSESRVPIIAIVNNTGLDSYALYVKPYTDEDWGANLLGTDILPNGESFRVKLTLPIVITDIYDIRIINIDDDTYTKYRVKLANGSNIVFTKRDSDEL